MAYPFGNKPGAVFVVEVTNTAPGGKRLLLRRSHCEVAVRGEVELDNGYGYGCGRNPVRDHNQSGSSEVDVERNIELRGHQL